MKRSVCSCAAGRHFLAVGAVVGVLALTAGTSWAQQRRSPVAEPPAGTTEAPAEAAPPADGQEPEPGLVVITHGRESRVRILGPVVVAAGQRVGDVVAVLGSVTVKGDVEGDVVAVGGSVTVEDGASVSGDMVAVGGRLEISPGATISPSSERVAVGFPEFSVSTPGEQDFSFRLLPDRTWMAGLALTGSAVRLFALALLSLMALVLFAPAVERIAHRVAESPAESLVVGLGAQLLLAPAVLALSLGLAITVIGIPLVPLFLLLVAGLWMTGFAAAAVAVGRGVLRLVGVREAGLLPAFATGVLPAVALTIASRVAWWSGANFGGWALAVAVLGALLEGLLWTLGAGAGVLAWLRRPGHSVAVPPVPPAEPPSATPVAVHL